MILKLLGILDVITAILFWLFAIFGIIPSSLILVLALVLLSKGIFFLISEHFASVVDIIIAAVMFLSISFHIPQVIAIILTLILLQKGVISLL